jgi:NADH dehydrogenase FAD-containing subunit
MEHIVIIGNGIAGVTLARHIRKNQIQKLLLYLLKLSFLFHTALMYVFMGMKFEHNPMKIILEKNKINLVQGLVTTVVRNQRKFC